MRHLPHFLQQTFPITDGFESTLRFNEILGILHHKCHWKACKPNSEGHCGLKAHPKGSWVYICDIIFHCGLNQILWLHKNVVSVLQ